MHRPRRPQVILKTPGAVADIIVYATQVNGAMEASPYFGNLVPSTADFAQHIEALAAAQAIATTRAAGAAAARDVELKTVLDDLESRRGIVQNAVNANPSEAKVIATSAAMDTKGYTPHHKAVIEAVLTGAPGQVLVRAKATKGAVYEWELSADGGATWASAGVSNAADITLSSAPRSGG